MTLAFDLWKEVSLVPTDLEEISWHEIICLQLYASDVLPFKRSELHHDTHLQFVRFLVNLPSEGATVVVSKDFNRTLLIHIKSAVIGGYLEQLDTESGVGFVIRPSEKLDHLLNITSQFKTNKKEAA